MQPELNPGEFYVGLATDPEGKSVHHVVLLPGDDCAKAILALREADQRGVASSLEHLAPCSAHDSRETALAPHHPGGQAKESTRGQSVDSLARESVADMPASPGPVPAPGDMVLVPRKTMRLIRLAFLPTNPNRMRAAAPDVVAAAREFVALAAAEEARNAT